MQIVHQEQKVIIDWSIMKGVSTEREDFSRTDKFAVFLVGGDMCDTIPLYGKDEINEIYNSTIEEDGKLHFEISEALPVGIYSLRAVWVKNGHRNIPYYAEKRNIFVVTDAESEATNPDADSLKLSISSHVYSYGYDGMSAYETAFMYGLTTALTEREYVQIRASYVDTNQIANDAITAPKIADGAIVTPKIADGAIARTKLADGSVITQKIVDNSVVEAKIANTAVTSEKIADLNVTTPKIADNAVTSEKIANGAVTSEKIAGNSADSDAFEDGAITWNKLHSTVKSIINNILTRLSNLENKEDADSDTDTDIAIPKPTGVSKIYNGSEQTLIQESIGYSIEGNYKGTNAGSYTAVCKLNNGYKWNDNSKEDYSVINTITPKTVAIPQKQTITYDGATHTFASDTEAYQVRGGTAGTSVGPYEATYILRSTTNYRWNDGSTSDKTVTHEIKSAPATYTLYSGTRNTNPDTEAFTESEIKAGASQVFIAQQVPFTKKLSGNVKCKWVAVPSQFNVKVVDDLGSDITENVGRKNITIGGVNYIVYYKYYIIMSATEYSVTIKN